MARIAGINIPLNKRVEIGLTYIYGIGRPTSNEILAQLGIEQDRKVRDLTDDEVSKLRDIIDRDYVVEGDLRREGGQKELKAVVGSRRLRGPAPPARPAGPRPEHQDQRPHAGRPRRRSRD